MRACLAERAPFCLFTPLETDHLFQIRSDEHKLACHKLSEKDKLQSFLPRELVDSVHPVSPFVIRFPFPLPADKLGRGF